MPGEVGAEKGKGTINLNHVSDGAAQGQGDSKEVRRSLLQWGFACGHQGTQGLSEKGNKKLRMALVSILISVVVYFGIAAVLIVTGTPSKPDQHGQGLDFKELFIDYKGLPELKRFRATDGTELSYRHYPSVSEKVLILLHGSGYHSRYLFPLARFISAEGLAHVYTPDLRGHGPTPVRRGDVDYIGQLEDDLADLIAVARRDHPHATVIVGGHSSGGGLALRFAGSRHGKEADAYLLLSPFLKYNAPTLRPHSGGWAQPYTRRIAGLVMLNNVGIRWFNHLSVIRFNMPEQARDGSETLSYSFRLNTAYAPQNYEKDLKAIRQPLLVVVGTADEAFEASQFKPVISRYTTGQVVLLEGVSHMGVVVGKGSHSTIKNWLEDLKRP
jgi:alpha-beta hydrolase superfamily lysophospholipase